MPREVKSKKSKASGLGKGLGNLMKVDSVESVLPEKEIHELPISELVPNADQPRKSFDEDSLATLAESIKNLGIFQPIVVRKQKLLQLDLALPVASFQRGLLLSSLLYYISLQ